MAEKNMDADINVEFEESASRQQLNSGESVVTLFGKIKKFFADLKAVAFSGAYSDLSGVPDLTQYATKAELDTKAEKALYGDTTINVGRNETTTVGEYSSALGYQTVASGNYSHAEGHTAAATGSCSHAEGYSTQATGYDSHAGGYASTAAGAISFAHGSHVSVKNENEVGFGAYNKSSDNTLFSIGDGTSWSEQHNAIEITTTGGKLHDKDIATIQQYAPIYTGDLLDMTEMGTYSCSQDNCTNLPSEIYSWCYVTMTSFRDAGYRQFVCSPFNSISSNKHSLYLANEAFKDSNGNLIWDKFYSDRYKPYVTGSATVEANSNVCVSNHGFTPSAVIWWDGSLSGVAVSFSDTKFTIDKTNSVDRTINYLMFK